jgi:TPR repeat protein
MAASVSSTGMDHIPTVSLEKQQQFNHAQDQQHLSFSHDDITSQDASFQHAMNPHQMQMQQEYEQQIFQQQQQQQFEQAHLWQQQQQQQDSYNGLDDPANLQQDQSLLSHAHLKPGHKATLLSYTQTLELYRQNAKKTNDPELQFEFAAFMIDAGKPLDDPQTRAELFDEAMKLLRKLATNGHAESQHYLAECFASGFARGKPDFDKAFPLWVQASKHGHPDAAYRTARCYDEGLGTRKDNARAVQFYR